MQGFQAKYCNYGQNDIITYIYVLRDVSFLSFYLCFSITQYGFLQQSHRDPVESLKSFVLKHFYVILITYRYCWQLFIFTMHTTHIIMLDCNNRITLNKPSYALCFLLWRHNIYRENRHHVELSHRITNLSRNVDYTRIKLLRLIFTKTGMCSVALKSEVDLSICRHSFVDTLYKEQENAKNKMSSTA